MKDHEAIDEIAKAIANFDGANAFETVSRIAYIIGRNEISHNEVKEQK